MVYVQSSPGAGGPQKHHYDCKRCIVDYTEVDSAEPKPDRARKLDKHPILYAARIALPQVRTLRHRLSARL